jgi:hypothetical protein
MLKTALRHQVALSWWLSPSTMGCQDYKESYTWKQASISKQSIGTEESQNKCKRLSNPRHMYKSKSRQSGELMTMVGDISPCVIQGMKHTVFEHKLGEEKCDRWPLVSTHLIKILSMVCNYYYHLFLFWKGNIIVSTKISITLKKKSLWGPWRKFYFYVFLNLSYCYVIFTEEKTKSMWLHKRNLIKQWDRSLHICTSRFKFTSCSVRNHISTLPYCS